MYCKEIKCLLLSVILIVVQDLQLNIDRAKNGAKKFVSRLVKNCRGFSNSPLATILKIKVL
jgi:hypothetical protein